MTKIQKSKLEIPGGEKRVLLHSCCVVCCGAIVEQLKAAGIDCTIFFYNPNIQPQEEYERRKDEQLRFARKMGVPFVQDVYDPEKWLKAVKGLETEPEKGPRCSVCFELRLQKTAQYAAKNNFKVFTSTFGLSRFKDMDQVNACGARAAASYPGLTYWTFNWRKGGGSQRMYEIAKSEKFYQQTYCGCVYSKPGPKAPAL